MTNQNPLRAIPSVNDLLDAPDVRDLIGRTSRDYVRDLLRGVLDRMRADVLSGKSPAPENLAREAIARLHAAAERAPVSLRRVINATGVVLHTNLGRAPLSERAIEAIAGVARGYSNLEYDLDGGRRGKRDDHGEALLRAVTGCEAAVVANNNAAAVMLVLNTFAEGGEVIVSRGELVEIGGGFRVPEVLERAGCTLREVGTTNRTRASDFERAITANTRLLLRVHPSNYKIIGFTERPEVAELAEIARRHAIPLVDDLGSGCLVDVRDMGLGDEPRCRDVLANGADLVTFSGDKLLGGPQAGIIAGREALIDRIRHNPLLRALRVDKMVYAGLEATLRAYVEGRARDELPALRMLAASRESLEARASRLAEAIASANGKLSVTVTGGRSVPGAGSAPGTDLPTALVAVEHPAFSASRIEETLRANDPPIIARIEHDRLVLDVRAIAAEEEPVLVEALARVR